jgi:hypothetical protein
MHEREAVKTRLGVNTSKTIFNFIPDGYSLARSLSHAFHYIEKRMLGYMYGMVLSTGFHYTSNMKWKKKIVQFLIEYVPYNFFSSLL